MRKMPSDRLTLNRVGVVGLGLIGGSIARALEPHCEVVAYDQDPKTRDQATEAGINVATELVGIREGRPEAVFVATPIPAFPSVFEKLSSYLTDCKPVISDVGSVKSPVRRWASRLLQTKCGFVGGHPMAGTEHSGFEASSQTLFQAQSWVLCVEPETDLTDVLRLGRLLTKVGAKIVTIGSTEHDRTVAIISHLPHVAAAALQLTVDGSDAKSLLTQLAAGSFGSATRVAGSRPQLVTEMCFANSVELQRGLKQFEELLEKARSALSRQSGTELEQFFSDAHQAHDDFMTDSSDDAWGISHDLSIDMNGDLKGAAETLVDIGRAGGWIAAIGDVDANGLVGLRYRLPHGQ